MCPNINLLRTYKVYPRVHQFNYMKDLFFIYVYLDPFRPLERPLSVKIDNEEFCFAYTPFYIGKGTGTGYRHNQHMVAFEKGTERNIFKIQEFQKLKDNMAKAVAMRKKEVPWNIKEFKERYVVILKTFEDPKELLKYEMQLINKIGTLFDHTGPLANRIKNAYKFNNLSSGQILEF